MTMTELLWWPSLPLHHSKYSVCHQYVTSLCYRTAINIPNLKTPSPKTKNSGNKNHS